VDQNTAAKSLSEKMGQPECGSRCEPTDKQRLSSRFDAANSGEMAFDCTEDHQRKPCHSDRDLQRLVYLPCQKIGCQRDQSADQIGRSDGERAEKSALWIVVAGIS
jgi:hypothetical protein